jgi:predicted PurR-regulated permease PerM
MELTKRVEVIAGVSLMALIAGGCLLVMAPFVSSILWAAVICFATWPLHQRLERLFGHRRTLSAAVMATLVILVTVLPFVLSITALNENITALLARVQEYRTQGLPQPPVWLIRLPLVGEPLHAHWAELATDSDRGHSFLAMLLEHSKPWLLRRSQALAIGVLRLGFSVVIAFFLYRDGDHLVARIAELGKRVLGEYSQHLVAVVGQTIRGVVYGFLGTALAQGLLASIGFTIANIPSAGVLGLLTFILALVPGGPPLVWIPASLWLVAQDRIGMAIFMGLWGLVAISSSDNVLRPYLISREARLPFVLVFLGAMGGILAFGFIGIFLGPTLFAVGFAILNDFLVHKNTVTPPHAVHLGYDR